MGFNTSLHPLEELLHLSSWGPHISCVSICMWYECLCLSGHITGEITMQWGASVATVCRRVSEERAGGTPRSQLNAIQQILERQRLGVTCFKLINAVRLERGGNR